MRTLRAILLFIIVCPAVPALAQVWVEEGVLTVSSSTLVASFRGASLIELRNRATGEAYVVPAQSLLDLNMTAPTGTLAANGWSLVRDGQSGQMAGQITYRDAARAVRLTVGVDESGREIYLRLEGRAARTGVRYLTWGIRDIKLDSGRLLVPGYGGVIFDRNTSPSYTQLDYPTLWETQSVVYEAAAGGGFTVYARDSKPYFKRLRVARTGEAGMLAFDTFAEGAYSKATEVPVLEWRLSGYTGRWQRGAESYRAWSRSVWPVNEAAEERNWVTRARGVVTVVNTDPGILAPLAERLNPSQTILYLIDWRSSAYDTNYPDYTPSDFAREFIAKAHELGFRVMLHVNALGVAPTSADYEQVKQYQMRFPEGGEPLTWPWDRAANTPELFAFISPAASAYRNLLIERLRPVVAELQPDAMHLDAGVVIINDANGPIEGMNSIEGLSRLYQDLQQAFPAVVFGSESVNEVIAPYSWLAQRWPTDLPGHAVSGFLTGSHILYYGFQDQPTPDHADFAEYLSRYEAQGVLPTPIVRSAMDIYEDNAGMKLVLAQLRAFQELGLSADFDTDGAAIFRYRSRDGSRGAAIARNGNMISLEVGADTLYRRLNGAPSVESSRFVPGWPAYDEQRIYGLDPDRQYWVTAEPFRPVELPHLLGVPETVKIGPETVVTPNFAILDLQPIERSAFDFLGNFTIGRVGTRYGSRDYPLMNGADAGITTMTVEGDFRHHTLLLIPPFKVYGGAVWAEYSVPVPALTTVAMKFELALGDAAVGRSDGVLVVVKVDETVAWHKGLSAGGWHQERVDLTPWAGRTVRLRIYVHPGERYEPGFDLVCFSKMRLVDDSLRQIATELYLPGIETPSQHSGISRLDARGDSIFAAGLTVPGKAVIFLNPSPAVGHGQDLISVPFSAWRTAYTGLTFPLSVNRSGAVEPAVSGRVEAERAINAYPPRKGKTILNWAIQVPTDAQRLVFRYGLADPKQQVAEGASGYTGVRFSVQVNGERVWIKSIYTNGWNSDGIDLTPWRGQQIVLQLVTDAIRSDHFDDAYWTGIVVQ